MKINRFTILGERCSGTCFLEEAITTNFDLRITWAFGKKHFFGFSDYHGADTTLFIGIVREPIKWANSLFQKQYHLQDELRGSKQAFLNNPCWSYHDNKKHDGSNYGKEILQDRHIYTKERYKNILELRNTKLHYLIYDVPKLVRHYILIRYEDLNYYYEEVLREINETFCLSPQNKDFIPITYYKKDKNKQYVEGYVKKKWFKKMPEPILKEDILTHKDFNKGVEMSLGYYPKSIVAQGVSSSIEKSYEI